MRAALPWLTQGDVFRSVPILLPELGQDGRVAWEQAAGPALLLTHGCVLDKASNAGVLKISRIFFLPILSIDTLDRNAKSLLRKRQLTPPEAIHLGNLGELAESFATLSEAYYLPAAFFVPRLSVFEGHPDAEPGERHLEATTADTRIGRVEESEGDLLLDKMNAFWTRREAAVPP